MANYDQQVAELIQSPEEIKVNIPLDSQWSFEVPTYSENQYKPTEPSMNRQGSNKESINVQPL